MRIRSGAPSIMEAKIGSATRLDSRQVIRTSGESAFPDRAPAMTNTPRGRRTVAASSASIAPNDTPPR
jgi:hypothetical protein